VIWFWLTAADLEVFLWRPVPSIPRSLDPQFIEAKSNLMKTEKIFSDRQKEKDFKGDMGVWQGAAMDSLKYYPGLPCPALLCCKRASPWNDLKTVLGVTRFHGGWPAAAFDTIGYLTRYAYEGEDGLAKLHVNEKRFAPPHVTCHVMWRHVTARDVTWHGVCYHAASMRHTTSDCKQHHYTDVRPY
jgi:hypothetical protein